MTAPDRDALERALATLDRGLAPPLRLVDDQWSPTEGSPTEESPTDTPQTYRSEEKQTSPSLRDVGGSSVGHLSPPSVGDVRVPPEQVAHVTGQLAAQLLAHLGLPSEGAAGPCQLHERCTSTPTREANGSLVVRCQQQGPPTTLPVLWLRRRQGPGVADEDAVRSVEGAAARCCYAILGHELEWLRLDVRPVPLPDRSGKAARAVAEAFALWEAAQATCDVFADPTRVVLSERLWMALAGQRHRKVWRAGRDWLLRHGVLVPAGTVPSAWTAHPTRAYRRAES